MPNNINSNKINFSKWYNDIILKAGLAENAPTRGCMVIKPYGYAIWEKMQEVLDKMFKDTEHQNLYFPLLIPKSFLSKEASHIEGFAKECAIVTHYRLKNNPNGKGVIVDTTAKLEEELIIRPTSETIIWSTYKNWIQSYRDLPLLYNQWANIVRWEMRTRLFLRTAEFLWQEGHTAHASKEEALEETLKIINLYTKFAEEWMAMPVLKGIKTSSERFAGAEETYSIEAMMQDGKALQSGTSHFLGQNFAKAFDVKFMDKNGKEQYVWATSWGVSTRLMGALIMAHGDNKGLVIPPKIAPTQVVIIPVYKNAEELENIHRVVKKIIDKLKNNNIRVTYDYDNKYTPGWKFSEYELKGIPLRLTIGKRDLKNNTIEVVRRDTLSKEFYSIENIADKLIDLLDKIQQNIYQKALNFRNTHISEVNSYAEFKEGVKNNQGFFLAHWDGTYETEQKIKEETKASIRCILLNSEKKAGKCMVTGKPSKQRVVFAKAY